MLSVDFSEELTFFADMEFKEIRLDASCVRLVELIISLRDIRVNENLWRWWRQDIPISQADRQKPTLFVTIETTPNMRS
jgi:hypothetical protein